MTVIGDAVTIHFCPKRQPIHILGIPRPPPVEKGTIRFSPFDLFQSKTDIMMSLLRIWVDIYRGEVVCMQLFYRKVHWATQLDVDKTAVLPRERF